MSSRLKRVLESEQILHSIKDPDVALERILYEARKIVNADAGTIYLYECVKFGGEIKSESLAFKYSQNDTQQALLLPGQKLPYVFFSVPISEKSISGYCFLANEIINIPNAYEIPPEMPYKFNASTDMATGYKTISMMNVPLTSSSGKKIGVLQIINAKNKKGQIIPFDEDSEMCIRHFALTATDTIERTTLFKTQFMRQVNIAKLRDPKETGGHVQRVSSFSVEIYERWAFNHNIPEAEQFRFKDNISLAALLHDVGKVAIPDAILKLPRRFTDEERLQINRHTYVTQFIFDEIESDLDKMTYDIALRHQEKWDGTGYPGKYNPEDITDISTVLDTRSIQGLKGEEIPICARIVSVSDVFDALRSKRCYKEEWTEEDARQEILRCSGTQFDPEVVQAFDEIFESRILPICRRFKDEE